MTFFIRYYSRIVKQPLNVSIDRDQYWDIECKKNLDDLSEFIFNEILANSKCHMCKKKRTLKSGILITVK